MGKINTSSIVSLLAQLADNLDLVESDLQVCEMEGNRIVRKAASRGQARLARIEVSLHNVIHQVMALEQQK